MPLVYKTRAGVRFVVWELGKKKFEQIRQAMGMLDVVADPSRAKDVRLDNTKYKVLGFYRGGMDPIAEIFLKKPYTLDTLTHEVYHAVEGSDILAAADEEVRANIIGGITSLVWKEGNNGKGAD